jgi:pyruvate formate lyase activating enzyme
LLLITYYVLLTWYGVTLLIGSIFDIKRFSIHDGPGIRTTVFFKGCPLACWWCHNPESQDVEPELILRPNRCIHCGVCLEACPEGAISDGDPVVTATEMCRRCGACVEVCYAEARELVGREMKVAEVMAEIERDVAFYDESHGGVTFSGGEPLMQPDFLLALLQLCKEKEIHTALDTCGYAPWQALDEIRSCVDLFLYDLKLIDDGRHLHFTGVSNRLILENLRRLSLYGHRIVLRVPIVPGVNDDEQSMREIATFVAELPALEGVDLLPYHAIGREKYGRLGRTYALPETPPPSKERIEQLRRLLGFFV